MYSTKSFCNVSAFASQEPGIVSPIGELTTYAKTFTKDLGFYHHTTLENYDLLNFSSVADDVPRAVSQTIVDQAITLVNEVTLATLGTSGELYYDEILRQLKLKAETINAHTVDIGSMVNAGPWWVPQWISWTDAGTAENNSHKVWLSLEAFQNQYTEFEIVVVPPFDNLDLFFNPGAIVETAIKAITPTQMIERAEVAKAHFPETVIRIDPYEYRDPIKTTRRFDVYWGVLVYGLAGNDPDVIRAKLVDYILAHSTHTHDEWAVIFPDIFKRTEFIMAPYWTSYAAEQRVFDHGIYSPIVDHAKPVEWLLQVATDYSADHLRSVTQTMAFPYRSMQMAVAGHYENRDGKTRITDFYPDFISAGTETTDFGRMSPATATWAMVLMEMVILAEKLTQATDLPRGTYRITRNGKVFIARSHERVLFLVLSKGSAPTGEQ